MKTIIFGLFLMLAGCDNERVSPPEGYKCFRNCWKGEEAYKDTCAESDKRAKFIIDCARAANPMSDEEGEDLVNECGYQARAIYCKRETVVLK